MKKSEFQRRMAFEVFDGLVFEPEHYESLKQKGYITAPSRTMPSGKEYTNGSAGEVISHPRLLEYLKKSPISIEDMKRLLVIEGTRFDTAPRATIYNILFARIMKAYKAEKLDEIRSRWHKNQK